MISNDPNTNELKLQELLDTSSEQFLRGNFKSAKILVEKFLNSIDDIFKVEYYEKCKKKDKKKIENSIVIVCYKNSDKFISLLEQLKPYSLKDNYEIIVVINGKGAIRELVGISIEDYILIDFSINVGASTARNIGARYSAGNNLIFIDDDGKIGEEAIEALVHCKKKMNAWSVRGKILPETIGSHVPVHYNRGDSIIPSATVIEGFVLWDKRVFLEAGGFDPLLWGHEGIHLLMKAFRFTSPMDYIYCPDAILFHDFDQNAEKTEAKLNRYEFNGQYIDYCGYNLQKTMKIMQSYGEDSILIENFGLRDQLYREFIPYDGKLKISVITTAKDSEKFLEEYTRSLRSQTYQNFEVIFIDDGSDDQTYQVIKKLWKGDKRLKATRLKAKTGRSIALNKAIDQAGGDILVIHDVDDVSAPVRFELTASYLEKNGSVKCLSFYVFNEDAAYRAARPFVSEITSMRARCFLGMPAVFPSFACTKDFISQKFDPEIQAGVDCDWLFRTFGASSHDGSFIPLPLVYYRIHDDQITANNREIQKSVAMERILELHRRYLGDFVDENISIIGKLAGWTPLSSGGDVDSIHHYLSRLKRAIREKEDKSTASVFINYINFGRLDLNVRRVKHDYVNLKKIIDGQQNADGRQPLKNNIWTWRDYVLYPLLFPFVKVLAVPNHLRMFRERPTLLFFELKHSKYRIISRWFFGIR